MSGDAWDAAAPANRNNVNTTGDDWDKAAPGLGPTQVQLALNALNAPSSGLSKGINAVINYPGKLLQEQETQHPLGPLFKLPTSAQNDPGAQYLLKNAQTPDPKIAGAIGTLGMLAGLRGTAGVPETFIPGASDALEQGHPLTGAVEAENAANQAHFKTLEDAGIKLPPREITPQQRIMNDLPREDLGLPKNAPVTSNLLDKADKLNVSPAYEAAKSVPAYQLGPKYQTAINKIDLLDQIDPKWQPPRDGTMTGTRAVYLSKQLRDVARGNYQDAENPNLTTEQRMVAKDKGDTHYEAAKAVEAGFREAAEAKDAATGTNTQTSIADNWDKARTYKATLEAWRGTLDGAGNVIAPKVKRLLGDDPFTGPMQRAATIAAHYPDLFKSTRIAAPTEGVVKRGIRAVAPMAGAAIGESIFPTGGLGAAGGAFGGESIANTVLGPRPGR